jgi:ABC-2 type transport system permease protein
VRRANHLSRLIAITRKELHMYFVSPVSYAAFAFFFVIVSYFFSANFIGSQLVDVRLIFDSMSIISVFVIPFLTMRLLSEELRQGTDELLFTSPANLTEIVLGKYLASLAVLLLIVTLSFAYPLILAQYGTLDLPVMWLSYLGYFVMGATMMSVGLFASSLSSNQMVSGIAALGILLLLWIIEWIGTSVYVDAQPLIEQFSLIGRLSDLQRGLFDLSDLIFYISLSALFVFLTVQVLTRKRWK